MHLTFWKAASKYRMNSNPHIREKEDKFDELHAIHPTTANVIANVFAS